MMGIEPTLSSSTNLGLWEKREIPQVPFGEADDSVEGERPPSLGPGCSAFLPGETRGTISSSHICVFYPQIELVDSAFAFEARSFPGLAVHNETALRGIHYPVALIASGAHGCEWPTYFSKLVQHLSLIHI